MANAASTANYQLLTITKNGKEIPLEGKTTSFDYYESLLSPNITAVMTFVDTGGAVEYDKEYDKQQRLGGIYNALPITGDGSEEVRFKIASKIGTLDFSRTPLYVNGSISPDQQSQRESVVLSLVSKSAITNQETHVKKNYSNRTNITDAVESIAKNILKLDKLQIDNTSNKYPFIGNNKSPFDVILMLASKSAPENGNPGFFFYETRDGHSFKAIDSLIPGGRGQREFERHLRIVRHRARSDRLARCVGDRHAARRRAERGDRSHRRTRPAGGSRRRSCRRSCRSRNLFETGKR